ncbi:MAG TPA: DUF6152 family protein [Gammaproteobacteria bacterium]|nr:DUF6152 family protein [Gammaproteobacteria bacterium]
MRSVLPPLSLLSLLTVAAQVRAHHSTVAIYDGSRTAEVAGVVEEISWRNPHGRLVLRADDGAVWEAEMPATVVLRILGIRQDLIETGDRITMAGAPARRAEHQMSARNILLASGYELAFGSNTPHFPAGRQGNLIGRGYDDSNVEEAIANADGIFRVWSTNMTDRDAFPMFKGGYPINDAARAEIAKWDPLDNDLLRCGTKGMPLIMITPAPVELARDGDTIRMRIEEYDSRRTIYMSDSAEPPDAPTQMGFSRGRFEGETLVVETDRLRAQYFDPDGVPQSDRISLVERFTPNEDYTRLDYTVTVTDPVYFTEPFTLSRYFVWRPEMTVVPYNCLERDWN